ncbi:trehalose-6-phosphate synthase [Chloroflexota bacterium]
MTNGNDSKDSPTESHDKRPLIIIASNRGPFSFRAKRDGSFDVKRGAGGLVTALGALAKNLDVLWIAAAQSRGDQRWAKAHQNRVVEVEGIQLRLVQVNKKRYEQYYNEIANPLLWFIQHQLWDVPRQPSISKETWAAWHQGYVAVNQQFAEVIAASVENIDRPLIIFPQDYHLYLVPGFLRQLLGERAQIQPFIHIPWPGPDAWRILPEGMRMPILSSLLASDRIGFQTKLDTFNFVQTCRFYLNDAHSQGSRDTIHYKGRTVKSHSYPISIDVNQVMSLVQEPQTHLQKSQLINFIGDKQLILRVDRVEPSKNILRGLQAYQALLEAHPEHRGKVQMLAILVPSRMEVEEYQTYLREIMAEAGMINAAFSNEFWEPVRLMVGENYKRAIAAMQRYDVLLVNPVADGMNLVAKEGALVNERSGVLVLSEYAGAFFELGQHALVVSPFDVHGTAEMIHTALTMPHEERGKRAEALRQQVVEADVTRWFAHQMSDAIHALNNQAKNSSTSGTPDTNKSALSRTESGVPSDTTPKPTQ